MDVSNSEPKLLILTKSENESVKKVPFDSGPKVVVFFIGGAGDARPFLGTGPHHNIQVAKDFFDKKFDLEIKKNLVRSVYLGYFDVFGGWRIKNLVKKTIPNGNVKIYIVGHSLGGWNGAHFSQKLSDVGLDVEVLITLDPVGEDCNLKLFADIYPNMPQPVAKYWVNLRYEQSYIGIAYDNIKKGSPGEIMGDISPNLVADLGHKWFVGLRLDGNNIKRMPNINETIDVNHAYTLTALKYELKDKVTAWNILEQNIRSVLGE
ncbi:alpha/beta hydrolase [Chromobacterium subtsugae]|uniref:alpha/beta hydrolase n=1 Tax=Chromobacterium subtsugae TaxID=251747 RepID=UPI000A808A68|nr:alpha/beta hydrolase [Chromobacterium subtsugae]